MNMESDKMSELKKVKLSEIDYKFKSGNLNKDTMLISYVIDLCS